MRCKYCDVEVTSDTFVCPLCHEKMEIDSTVLPLNYMFPPKRKKQTNGKKLSVLTWYLCVALILYVTATAIDFSGAYSFHWSYLVGAALAYGAFLIKFVIFAHTSVGVRVFWQLVAMTITVLTFGVVLDGSSDIVIKYVLPIIIMVSIIVQSSFCVIYASRKRSIFLSSILISLIGFVPLICYASGAPTLLWLAIASGVVGTIAIIGIIVLGNKAITYEVRRRFHM